MLDRKKKAILMGMNRVSHCASVIWKLAKNWARLDTRRYLPFAIPSKRVAQASQAQTICRSEISTRCGCSCARALLHNSQRSVGRGARANWRSVANAWSKDGGVPAAGVNLHLPLPRMSVSASYPKEQSRKKTLLPFRELSAKSSPAPGHTRLLAPWPADP